MRATRPAWTPSAVSDADAGAAAPTRCLRLFNIWRERACKQSHLQLQRPRAFLNSRAMTVTQLMDRQISQNDDIGWGKKVSVTLVREPTTSFGVCIVGGKVNISKNLQVAGIFIKNIVPASPAETCQQIKIGDRILSVNHQDVRNATQEETIGLIKNAGCRIELVLQSFDGSNLPDASAQSTAATAPLKSAIRVDLASTRNRSVKISTTVSRSVTPDNGSSNATATAVASATTQRVATSGSDSSSSDDEEEETSGKVTSKAGYEIDRKSAGNLKRTKEEAAADSEKENNFGYTDQKLKKKYGPLGGRIIRANIQRDDGCLGLAMAGHRDRTKMGCFVAGINPKGSASSQNVKIGDELLEISGVFLHRMCHLNASVIIKGIPGIALEFILLRADNGVEEMAVKPVVSFPAAFDQFDQLYSCFKNVRNVTIQKVGTSLGIMIIEGKHSEVGQGIFISDIQENSNAELAGVKIGEMVLAVNKDLLIDTNYDTAAGLLKRAEGIVTLTLCNPNKKEGDADEAVASAGAGASAGTDAKAEVKKPEPPPEPEVPKDPATAPIDANKDTVIEINADKKPLGIVVVKGDSSAVQSGASVIVIHENGAVHKDNRLKVFDKITEIDGKKISSETSDHEINKIFQSIYPRVKITVYRAEPPDLKEMDVEITKKSGKDIGLSFAECKDNGIYVLDIAAGSEVDKDKRMIRGDIVTHINGDDIRKCNFIESTILLKAAQPKITFKVVRPKGKK